MNTVKGEKIFDLMPTGKTEKAAFNINGLDRKTLI